MGKGVSTALVGAVVIVIAAAMLYLLNIEELSTLQESAGQSMPTPVENQIKETKPPTHIETQYGISPLFTDTRGCENKDSVIFASLPMPIDAVRAAEPLGELTDRNAGHIIPGDHSGLQYDKGGVYDVSAMADGYIVRVERNKIFLGINQRANTLIFLF